MTAGFGEHSIIQAPMAGVLLVEVLGAALLVAVFLGTTSGRNPAKAAAPFAVGLTMAVLLQLGQAVGNAPFNPARATASAIFSNTGSLGQLWLFWVAPLVGAAIAGLVFRGFAQTAAQPRRRFDGCAGPRGRRGRRRGRTPRGPMLPLRRLRQPRRRPAARRRPGRPAATRPATSSTSARKPSATRGRDARRPRQDRP